MIAWVDPVHAAAVIAANGSDLDPRQVAPGTHEAFLFPDRDAADRGRLVLTRPFGWTLIGEVNVEGGWLSLYRVAP